MPEIAVVVGNHQGAAVLGDCLESLHRQTRLPAEVLVVDGASTDASANVAAAHGARCDPERRTTVSAISTTEAPARRLRSTSSSRTTTSRWTSTVLLCSAARSTGKRRGSRPTRGRSDWDGTSLVHARATFARGRYFHELVPGFRLDLKADAHSMVPTVTANGACMLVRRTMLLELDGFDETFFMDFEDIDLCWRAWLRGWESVYVPDAWVRHRVGAVTTTAVLPRRLAASHHNLMRFALKCLPAREAALVVATELARWPRHRGLVLRPLREIARELPAILRSRRRARPAKALLRWFLDGQRGDLPQSIRQTARYR